MQVESQQTSPPVLPATHTPLAAHSIDSCIAAPRRNVIRERRVIRESAANKRRYVRCKANRVGPTADMPPIGRCMRLIGKRCDRRDRQSRDESTIEETNSDDEPAAPVDETVHNCYVFGD